MPPPAPRQISDRYVWRLLLADGWSIAAFVFGLIGAIFSLVGAGLTLAILTALVGIPFLLLGVVLMGTGGLLLWWRHQKAQKVVRVLREGDSAQGQITEVQQNYSVRINGRNPWIIGYEYLVNGRPTQGA